MASGAFRELQEAGIICNNHPKQALHGCLGNRASFLGYFPSYHGTYRHRLCRLCAELQGIGMNPSSVINDQ